MNKALDKAISEQKNAAERAMSEIKQVQKNIQGIVKALEGNQCLHRRRKRFLVRNFLAKFLWYSLNDSNQAVVKSLHEKCESTTQFNPAER